MTTLALTSADGVLEAGVSRLPPPVQRKYRRLEDERHDAYDAAQGAARRWEEARDARSRAQYAATMAASADQHSIERANHRRLFGKPAPPSPEAEATAARLAQATEFEETRRRSRDEADATFAAAQQLLSGCQNLIRNTDATQLAPIMLPTAPPSWDVTTDLAHVRTQIEAVHVESAALNTAPVPAVEAAARLDDYLAGLAQQWAPPVAMDFTRADYRPPSPDDYTPHRAIVLLAALPCVRAALHERLQAAYERLPASVPSADRPARAADLATRQRQLELAEEQLILEAEQAGHLIARRPDADPRVVLTSLLAE
jgi:hypothetical protein